MTTKTRDTRQAGGGATMREHDFCRLVLNDTLRDMRSDDPKRFVAAEVTGDAKIGNCHHYWVKVTDHRFAEGTKPTAGSPGHARFMEYEVEACCRYQAKAEALGQLDKDFPVGRAAIAKAEGRQP